ncbi:nucleotidyltransferase family protein [Sphingomonas sp. QA11]|uniref:nucleotidyltransferase family protein n=1 Tax=Sphingomonas sp. QA11 TaxID=2950605 RepID=UPI00234959B1|nr:nucleotidyltransferase family protein [Sphingomonas sp. QA11]WCM27465.1 nucleotidyltransferase family protein [Sphingomonas sp. QA11]
MIHVEKTVLILLAAGRSERFGDVDKLEQNFLGQPLAMHVVTAFEDIPFQARFVVKNGTDLDFGSRGYRVIHNDDPQIGMSRSVKLGVQNARDDGAEAVVIALADMPRVTASHLYHLIEAMDSRHSVVASSDGVNPCPPAVFGAGQFDFLLNLEGDAGARDLVRAGRHVVTSPAELIDIDTPADLERLRALVRPL